MVASFTSEDDRPLQSRAPRTKKRAGKERIAGLFEDLDELAPEERSRKPEGNARPPSELLGAPTAYLPHNAEQPAPEPPRIEPEAAGSKPPSAPPSAPTFNRGTPVPSNGAKKPTSTGVRPNFSGRNLVELLPETQTLTPLAWESLRVGKPVTDRDLPETAADAAAAVLAMGRPLPGNSGDKQSPALLLELIDEDRDREWSEDDRLLIEQVSDQLTLALENARLFQEARHRNEELTVLNRVAGAVSGVMDLDKALNEVLHQVLEAIGFSSGLISMVDPATGRLKLAVTHNLPEKMVEMLAGMGLDGTLCDLVYQSGQTLYLPNLKEPPIETLLRFGEPPKVLNAIRGPLQAGYNSYLGAPLLSKGVSLGTVCAMNSELCEVSESRIRLQEAIGQQVGVVIENVRLFEQTERTRDALQVSERYQKGIAQAVAALTERGITALSEVLELLGTAAQVGRVHYMETQVDQNGPYWRALSEWRASTTASRMGSPAFRRLGLDGGADWLQKLCQHGYCALSSEADGATEIEAAFGAASALLFAVPGRQELPGCMVFEQVDQTREWTGEEVSALQTAAAALANTIVREDLFTQVQANLAETEAQYQASSRLNSATSYTDILAVLRRHTILGHVNTVEVSLNLFDHTWTRTTRPEWLKPIAVWRGSRNTSSSEESAMERIALSDWITADLLLDSERPTMVLDAGSDPRLDAAVRHLYVDPHSARSLVFVPLNVSGRWIGHVIGVYRQTTAFPERELRRLTSLAGQATVALEGLRLVEELQQRARQLQTAAEIARDTSSTLALDALLTRSVNLLSERFGYPNVSIFLLDDSSENAVVAGAAGLHAALLKRQNFSLPVGDGSVVGKVISDGETLVIDDLFQPHFRELYRDESREPGAQDRESRSELGIPLKYGDQVIGALDVQSNHINAFTEDDVAVLRTLTDQIAVAVENARAYEMTQKAVEEIREADRLKTQFLANMSHELRTPLNSIIGFSRVILKGIDGPINEQQNQDLTAIYNSGQHLLGLINDVLDLSRIEAGKMDLAFETGVNLADVIRSVMSTTMGLVKDKPIELKQHIAPDLPLMRIDPMKIRQVLINLLSNAAKFTDEGSISVEAERQMTPAGTPGVIVRVIDTGPGIAQADQNRLFQPFSQVDGSLTRKTGGSGLGLSICQHLIRMHDGEIGLESEVGSGSTFFFILPIHSNDESPEDLSEIAETLNPSADSQINQQSDTGPEKTPAADQVSAIELNAPPTAADAATASAATPALENPAYSAPAMILAVDRDPNVTELYRRYLSDRNITVISLAVLEQVVAVARSIQPLAITLDVTMQARVGSAGGKESAPDADDPFYIDGWQVLQALKSNPETSSIPILICSLAADNDRAKTMGASGVLMKPILQDELIHALDKIKQ